ncbi:ABC-three component system protein [Nocardioides abyssi]|uniref:ABC-three component systems C-terminal domain-containing protein n=1 Tax=Nocardioides abyssi TaxID=3058370 RepID=A0ABT8EYU8_9ACTN|nr:ABC-three component system protein [Nocardioides abyssi]MDN4163362.1 hypothetical protein [Nocardioides abyssi]
MQRITFYSPEEWEIFIREWVRSLDEDYEQVKRLGGAGDRGADIAAFLTSRGFEDEWDCYQCKHYDKALQPSDAWPEIFKVFETVLQGGYTMPRKYFFVAPRNCGPKFEKLLSTPTKLREEFLRQCAPNGSLAKAVDKARLAKVLNHAKSADFSVFDCKQVEDVLEQHRRTPHWAGRFGGPLPTRPPASPPPSSVGGDEARYVSQLMAVYSERHGTAFEPDAAAEHPEVGEHFQRQREAFYCAEALRVFARDQVQPGTFEALQKELFSGVVEIEQLDHANGWERLGRVLHAATTVDLSANGLHQVTLATDKKGMCHQLANDDKLRWVR